MAMKLEEVRAERDLLGRERNFYRNQCDVLRQALRSIRSSVDTHLDAVDVEPPREGNPMVDGMTYRQWLAGQFASGVWSGITLAYLPNKDSQSVDECVKDLLGSVGESMWDLADAVIRHKKAVPGIHDYIALGGYDDTTGTPCAICGCGPYHSLHKKEGA